MKTSLVMKKEKEREFLEQLLDGGKLKNYTVPVPINAELRQYQQVMTTGERYDSFNICLSCFMFYEIC